MGDNISSESDVVVPEDPYEQNRPAKKAIANMKNVLRENLAHQ